MQHAEVHLFFLGRMATWPAKLQDMAGVIPTPTCIGQLEVLGSEHIPIGEQSGIGIRDYPNIFKVRSTKLSTRPPCPCIQPLEAIGCPMSPLVSYMAPRPQGPNSDLCSASDAEPYWSRNGTAKMLGDHRRQEFPGHSLSLKLGTDHSEISGDSPTVLPKLEVISRLCLVSFPTIGGNLNFHGINPLSFYCSSPRFNCQEIWKTLSVSCIALASFWLCWDNTIQIFAWICPKKGSPRSSWLIIIFYFPSLDYNPGFATFQGCFKPLLNQAGLTSGIDIR